MSTYSILVASIHIFTFDITNVYLNQAFGDKSEGALIENVNNHMNVGHYDALFCEIQ